MEELKRAGLRALLIALYVGPIFVLVVTYWLVSLPLRRRERARVFLDLLEMGLEDGKTPERSIVEAARSEDRILGRRFYFLAELLGGGMSLPQALKLVPRLLPPTVSAMLAVGAELGDVRRVLPACRQTLRDALSQTRGALNYLAVLAFVILPVVPVLSTMMSVYVLPKFELLGREMSLTMPAFSQLVFVTGNSFAVLQIAVMIGFQFLMLCYVVGPRMRPQLTFLDHLLWLLPWRRKRIQRDFATLLALLLDAGVPEQRAVQLASEGADNLLFQKRAQRVAAQLMSGVKLTEAVRALDDSGEFHWRLTNAQHSPQGFIAALRGWFESLDAKAFQQEQAAAQVLTTALVLWNGLVIGIFVIGMFNVLTNIIEEGVLW